MNECCLRGCAVLRRLVSLVRILLTGVFLFCLVTRIFIKDWIAAFAVVYYSVPWPVLVVFAFFMSMIWVWSKRIRLAQLYFGITIGCLAAWFGSSFAVNLGAPTPGSLRVFFWNAAHHKNAADIAHYVHEFDADFIGIDEAGARIKRTKPIWQSVFPGYEVELLGGQMAFLTKGKILSKAAGALGQRGRFNSFRVALHGEQSLVVLVDIDGEPFESRAPAFAPLAEIVRLHCHDHLVVMGDFNTPLDSVLFQSFRQYLTHAFEGGGTGFDVTWPVPLPVLAIDHIWISKSIKVTGCQLSWSRLSDHRAVLTSFAPPLLKTQPTCAKDSQSPIPPHFFLD